MTYAAIRTSMSLDQSTIQTLQKLAAQIGISKSEVMRRAVREFSEHVEQEAVRPTPLHALAYLQGGGGLNVQEAAAFREELEAERQAKHYWWE